MSRICLKWTLDEEISLLETVKINKENHKQTALDMDRTLHGVLSRLIGIYRDRLKVYQGHNPDDLMEELYLTPEQVNIVYKPRTKKKTILNEIELLNIKLGIIINKIDEMNFH